MPLKSGRVLEVERDPRLAALPPEASLLAIIARHLHAGSTPRELLSNLQPLFSRAADTEWMILVEPRGDRLELKAASGEVTALVFEQITAAVSWDGDLIWKAISDNRPIFVKRFSGKRDGQTQRVPYFKGAGAYLPLSAPSRKARGVLILACTRARGDWLSTTQATLEAAASMIGSALAWHTGEQEGLASGEYRRPNGGSSQEERDSSSAEQASHILITDFTPSRQALREIRKLNARLEQTRAARTRDLEQANIQLLGSNLQLERTNRVLGQLMKDAIRHAADQRYLADLMRELELQDCPQTLMDRVGQRLLARVEADLVVTLVRRLDAGLELWSLCGDAPQGVREAFDQISTRAGRHGLWEAVGGQDPLYINDITINDVTEPELLELLPPALLANGLCGAARVPFAFLDSHVGLLVVLRFRRRVGWTSEQRTLLEATVSTLQLSFQRAHRIAMLDEARRYAEAMVGISRLTDTDQSPEELAGKVAEAIATAADVDMVTLSHVEGDRLYGTIVCRTRVIDARLEAIMTQGLARGGGLIWSVVEGGSAVYSDDYASSSLAIPSVVEAGLRSLAVVPVDIEGSRSSLLFAMARVGRARPWTQRDRALLEAAGRSLRIANERWRRVEEFKTAALTDVLTGLGNRRAFMNDLVLAIKRAERHRESFALVILDLDGLKKINDREGHVRGDRLLEMFGEALPARLRGEDRCYRLGGDEYAALLVEASVEDFDAIRERIREAVEEVRLAGFDTADVSAGLAAYPLEARTADELIALADRRMYQEKEGHRQKERRMPVGEPSSPAREPSSPSREPSSPSREP